MSFSDLLLSHLTPSRIIVNIMVVFMSLGAVYHLIGNRLGLASSFTDGFAVYAFLHFQTSPDYAYIK